MPFSPTRLLARLLFSALCAYGPAAGAQTLSGQIPAVMADPAPSRGVAEAVRLAGSPRMAGYLLTDPALPAHVRASGDRLLARVGHGPAATPWEGAVSVSPFLRYDANLNGGFPEDHIMAGGFRFEVAEADRAVAGPIAGAILSYGGRAGLGGGTALEFRSSLMAGHALEHDLKKVAYSAEVCLRHMARRDLYLHGCLDAGGSRYELGRSDRTGARIGVTRILGGLGGVHELTIEGRLERDHGVRPYERGLVALSLLSAMPGPVVWSARAELGQPVEGVLVTRARVQLGATFELMDRPTTVSVDWRRSTGGLFLGAPREDRTVTLSVSRPLSDRVRVSLALTRNASSAAPYDRNTVDLGVSMRF
ncbi:hypothetical protein IQ03_01278 [Gemmobacter caeni]|uniref:Autotransporter-like protein n=1 Tax=Gemmobacter caeni TaxID=589035 RepID=A0A2T6B8T2_9RHOB|nr:hypothetical protein [Gemmobacter caeni]PTX52469.1 hypothetical protein C8N34_102249 [Gemmobacter caeni]TWJ02860.1 hypothetical protein IQ03_01278 [Gemmobacter caeni]